MDRRYSMLRVALQLPLPSGQTVCFRLASALWNMWDPACLSVLGELACSPRDRSLYVSREEDRAESKESNRVHQT